MLQFLNPVWLWGLTAVALPLAIHLLNIHRGKVLRVGSISLLNESMQSKTRTLRINEWLLLLLRSLLIVFLSLLLAGPQWSSTGSGNKDTGWILVEPGKKAFIDPSFSSLTDSLEKEGFRWKEFSPGFPDLNEQSLLDTFPHKHADYWELIRSLNDHLPGSFPVFLFTADELRHFKGSRPTVSVNLIWRSYSVTDSIFSFPAEAYAVSDDSVYVSVIKTTPSIISATPDILPLNQPDDRSYFFNTENGVLKLTGKNGISAAVDTATLRVSIFADPATRTDMNYLLAVLQTIKEVKKRKITIMQAEKETDILENQDWVFWLSGRKVATELRAKNIFRYSEGNPATIRSVIRFPDEGMEQESSPRLIKRNEVRPDSIESLRILWSDGTGMPVLHLDERNQRQYVFSSRFDPSWNDLVWHVRFPEFMYRLIYPGSSQQVINNYDKGRIREKQMSPLVDTENTNRRVKKSTAVSLSKSFWLIVFLFFLAERWVSHRNKKINPDVR